MQVLSTYNAVQFQGIMDGGTSKPWKITVESDTGLTDFVVKLYSEDQSHNPVRSEVLASVIAKELDLNTPDIALINFSEEFIQSLPIEQRRQLRRCDNNPKFGNKFITPVYPYTNSFKNSDLKPYDLESIYAFDNLILNVDRNNNKPNIFFREKGRYVYVIDHELSLRIKSNDDDDYKKFKSRGTYRNHLFYSRLVSLGKKHKLENFHTFGEHLRHINVNIIDNYILDLEEAGYYVDDSFRLKRYLTNVKRNHLEFIKLLRDTVNHE